MVDRLSVKENSSEKSSRDFPKKLKGLSRKNRRPKKSGLLTPVHLRIPANLDLEELLRKEIGSAPVGMVQELAYVCDLLVRVAAYYNFSQEDTGFYPLCSEMMRPVVREYDKLLTILKHGGAIKSDDYFIVGEKCTGYWFAKPFGLAGLKTVVVTDKDLLRKINKAKIAFKIRKKKQQRIPSPQYLKKWFNKKLVMDMQSAIDSIDRSLKELAEKHQATESNKDAVNREMEKYACYKLAIEKFGYPFRFVRDSTSGRVHTPLTNMKKSFKKFIRYNGEELVSVDIKNSQPYLLMVLAESKDLGNRVGKGRIRDKKEVSIKSSFLPYTITLTKLQQFNDNQSNIDASYAKDVTEGGLYEKVAIQLTSEGFHLTRDEVKIEVYKILFGSIQRQHNKVFKAFAKLYPKTAKFILGIKKDHKKNVLPILLQTIESYLIIDKVCKELSDERPGMPLFTIHDSVVTTKGNEHYVAKKMQEVFLQNIGHSPSLEISNFTDSQDREIWREVSGYAGIYSVSDHGRVRNNLTSKILRQRLGKNGYKTVFLYSNKKRKCIYVHRLVAEAFLPNTGNKCCVNHKDGNKTVNALSNLEWVTHTENMLHAYSSGLINQIFKTQYVINLSTRYLYSGIKPAARHLNMNYSTLKNSLNGWNKSTSHLRKVFLDNNVHYFFAYNNMQFSKEGYLSLAQAS